MSYEELDARQVRGLPMAFVATYLPRRCGIATFTHDLGEAVANASSKEPPMVLAVTDPGGQYAYPAEVMHELRQSTKADYARAAELISYSDVKVVSIQHEYGIFGGDDGSYILDFLSSLRVPSIATLHTVLKAPSASQRMIVQQLARHCSQLVVMSQVAKDLLARAYDLGGHGVQVIPHGIPALQPADQESLKARFGVAGRRMLLTFGLLSPNKGIETVLRALPEVVKEFPDLVYFVVGATHPVIVRRDGEAYRTLLEREAERLGVREHIVFRDQFVSSTELGHYLQATDVFVSPYLNEAQVTSGALSYAMGAGAAVLSTPYWHAQELLADGHGRLFPFRDAAALARSLLELLRSPDELRRARAAAFAATRSMQWPSIGRRYVELAAKTVDEAPARRPVVPLARASSLPELRLDHLHRLTDDTGIIQHATFSVPFRPSGYCVDDNARALIVALHAERLHNSTATRRLVTTYLSYLQHAQRPDGTFNNFMRYDRTQIEPQDCSDDCLGRALWALGAAVRLADDDGCRRLARDLFLRALPASRGVGPRGTALALLGVTNLLRAEPESGALRDALAALTRALVARHVEHATPDWRWFESTLTYDNATLPLALFESYAVTRDRTTLRVAREALEFLEEVCFKGHRLQLVGNRGWHGRGQQKAEADEQAIDASAFVLAFRSAYLATNERHYARRMGQAFGWFLGDNRLREPLYDTATAGCRDGLGPDYVNLNQGAESTVCFLMALIDMLELAGEDAERPEESA
ncbi:MAG: glycosyltransferase [Deltaproteobacteria bacterium]|nr:glycosyltransferase [Deltaproteobacteria bacterium]